MTGRNASWIALSLGLFAACASPTRRDDALVLEYADFGPAVMAHEVVGDEWYPWSKPGDIGIDERFDIHVVVYDGDRGRIERTYPTVENRADYRLLPRTKALAFLDASIDDLADEPTGPLAVLRGRLQSTRSRIIAALPEAQ